MFIAKDKRLEVMNVNKCAGIGKGKTN